MKILRALSDPGLGTRGIFREARAREAGQLFAAELLLPGMRRALRSAHPTPSVRAACRHLACPPAQAAPVLSGYVAAALANWSYAALAARTERGRDLIGAAINCLAGEGGWRE